RLGASKRRVIVTREPGGSPGAEIMRHLVLSGMGKLLGPEAETLLFAAARDDHVRTVIMPALNQGTWVLCDRFADSTRAYQGSLGSVPTALINAMQRVTIGDLKPDLTIILDLPVEIGLARLTGLRARSSPSTRACARPIARSQRTSLRVACWSTPIPILTRLQGVSGPRCVTDSCRRQPRWSPHEPASGRARERHSASARDELSIWP